MKNKEFILELTPNGKVAVSILLKNQIDIIDNKFLNPRENWLDKVSYDKEAAKLVKLFSDNFEQYLSLAKVIIVRALWYSS